MTARAVTTTQRRRGRAPLAALALVAASCQTPCFRDPRLLSGLRVLGVQADPVQPTAGMPVTLTLATADEQDRPLQIRWYRCPVRMTDPDAGALAQLQTADVEACLATTPIGTGASVTLADAEPTYVPPPSGLGPLGGLLDSGLLGDGGLAGLLDSGLLADAGFSLPAPAADPTRPRIEFVGYACAGGEIGATDPVTRYPSCSAGSGNGWVFTRTLYFPSPILPAGALPANPQITEVRFGPMDGPSVPITLDAPPTVPRCPDPSTPSSCPRFRFDVATTPSNLGAINTSPGGRNRSVPQGVDYVVTAGTVTTTPENTNGSTSRPLPCPTLESPDSITSQVGWVWRPPGTPGTVRIWITARTASNGFAWTERRVVVQ